MKTKGALISTVRSKTCSAELCMHQAVEKKAVSTDQTKAYPAYSLISDMQSDRDLGVLLLLSEFPTPRYGTLTYTEGL